MFLSMVCCRLIRRGNLSPLLSVGEVESGNSDILIENDGKTQIKHSWYRKQRKKKERMVERELIDRNELNI